ncbi:MAG: transposase [Thermodesulfobacteriota bacterium]
MARPYRLQAADCLYHITNRGNDRKRIFLVESDYKKFLNYLSEGKDRYQYYIYAYALMSNHYHILLKTTQANLSKIMHSLNTAYTVYYNLKHKKIGHLFQGRYKSIVVDEQNYFLELTRYIHLNPVKARIVEKPEDYQWSSYKCYLNKKGDVCIDKHEIKKYMTMGPKAYENFIISSIGEKETVFNDLYAGFLLGSVGFVKGKLAELKEQVENKDISYKGKLNNNIKIDDVVGIIARKYKIEKEDIYNSFKKPSKEKKIVLYLLKRITGMTNADIGKAFGISYSAVSKAYSGIARESKENKRMHREIMGLISHFKD